MTGDMEDCTRFLEREWPSMRQADLYALRPNPTFGNPSFETAGLRVLIARLSPFRDVERSLPHLFLFDAVRRAVPDAYVDLAFFPPGDDRRRLLEAGVPLLHGIESLRPATDFDVVLVSNAYLLELINLPYLLLHSGIPLLSSERHGRWPAFVLGGSNAAAAHAVVGEDGDALVDGIFFGEGEEQVARLAQVLREDARLSPRSRLERAAAEVRGLWLAGSLLHRTVERAVIGTPRAEHLPVDVPLLPGPEAGTARLQIAYGCPAFCTFCFEGYDRRPYREVPFPDVLRAARRAKQAQGCDTLELYSFNFNTHSDIMTLLFDLSRMFDRVGLKSQRVDILHRVPGLLEAEIAAEKRSFTLGIEGISDRLRAWLHKSLAREAIEGVLERLLRERARQIKLFYLLTGHETEADIAEFRSFVRWLKVLRRRHHPAVRVVFSFGLLVRMPFTPLRHDRLFLDPDEWRPIIGPVKSACETNGFEFRLAAPWEEYAVSQVLAMGGHWLLEALIDLARAGHCYDQQLSPGCWQALRQWMERHGRWSEAFLGEKGPDYPYPFPFLWPGLRGSFLYEEYERAREGIDRGYCLGGVDQTPGSCLGCGACDREQREAIVHHRLRPPDARKSPERLGRLVRAKRRLQPIYLLMRLPPVVAGAPWAWINAWVMRTVLSACPDQVENILSVKESLFAAPELRGRYPPGLFGWTVFSVRAWDATGLSHALARAGVRLALDLEYGSVADGFQPGRFEQAFLELFLPTELFPRPMEGLRDFLRAAYLPCNLRRSESGVRLDLSPKALRKRVLFSAEGRAQANGLHMRLAVSPKFDLLGFLRSLEARRGGYRLARVEVTQVTW